MRRRFFAFASALSLLLCMATVVLWVRSYWRDDGWSWGNRAGRAGIDSFRGRVIFGRVIMTGVYLSTIPQGQLLVSVPAHQATHAMLKPSWSLAGIQATYATNGNSVQTFDVRVPHWMLLLATGILPAVYLLRRRRWHWDSRVRSGLCGNCGYDLRASRDLCPECGTPATAAPPRDLLSWCSVGRNAGRYALALTVAVLVVALIQQARYDRSFPDGRFPPWWVTSLFAAAVAVAGLCAVKSVRPR